MIRLMTLFLFLTVLSGCDRKAFRCENGVLYRHITGDIYAATEHSCIEGGTK